MSLEYTQWETSLLLVRAWAMDDLVSKRLDLSFTQLTRGKCRTWMHLLPSLQTAPMAPASSCLCLAGTEAVFYPRFHLSPHLLLRCFICILHLCGNFGWTPMRTIYPLLKPHFLSRLSTQFFPLCFHQSPPPPKCICEPPWPELLFLSFEAGPPVAPANFEFLVLLSLPTECWDYKHSPPWMASLTVSQGFVCSIILLSLQAEVCGSQPGSEVSPAHLRLLANSLCLLRFLFRLLPPSPLACGVFVVCFGLVFFFPLSVQSLCFPLHYSPVAASQLH